jgi:hypothetical protein
MTLRDQMLALAARAEGIDLMCGDDVAASIRGILEAHPAPAPEPLAPPGATPCACGLYALSCPDECVDDQNRKVHTVARCGFGVSYPAGGGGAHGDGGCDEDTE